MFSPLLSINGSTEVKVVQVVTATQPVNGQGCRPRSSPDPAEIANNKQPLMWPNKIQSLRGTVFTLEACKAGYYCYCSSVAVVIHHRNT